MTRVYFAGSKNNLGHVTWMDPTTYVVTDLPTTNLPQNLGALDVLAEDDIWVGWRRWNNGTDYPRMGHWDGAAWTIYDIDNIPEIWPEFQQYGVCDIQAVSSTEVYAVVYQYMPHWSWIGLMGKVIKWNGATWSLVFTSGDTNPYIEDGTTLLPGSTETDMWICHCWWPIYDVTSARYVMHWNGTAIDDNARLGEPGTFLQGGLSGMVRYKGEILVASGNQTVSAHVGVNTWEPRFNVPPYREPDPNTLSWGPNPKHGWNALWHDRLNGVAWCGYYDSPPPDFNLVRGLVRWDGTNATYHPDNPVISSARKRFDGSYFRSRRRRENLWDFTY